MGHLKSFLGGADLFASALESLLRAKIVTTRSLSLDTHSPEAVVQEWEYLRLSNPTETGLHLKLLACGEVTASLAQLEQTKAIVEELGPWCADQAISYAFEEERFQRCLSKHENPNWRDVESEGTSRHFEQLKKAKRIIQSHHFPGPQATLEYVSPKVQLLYNKLCRFYTDNPGTRCLIFVDQRITALLLQDLFHRLFVPNLRCDIFVGVGGGNRTGGGTSLSGPQARKLKGRFEEGEINCLFCTSVAEEGIDSPQCNLVVRFNLYNTMIQYMQSRGRARASSSIYGQMIEKENARHRLTVEEAYHHEIQLREFLNNLEEDRFLETDFLGIGGVLSDEKANQTFMTAAGAKCSYRTAIECLHCYATSLQTVTRGEAFVAYEPEITDGMFQFRTVLPEVSPLSGMVGKAYPSKKIAKQSAAWETCVQLRRKCLLDEKLVSIYAKEHPVNSNAKLAISSSKKTDYPMLVKPNFWSLCSGKVPKVLYATIVLLIPSHPLTRIHDPLLLLTRSPMPPLPEYHVYLEEDVETRVVFTQIMRSYPVDPSMLKHLEIFTLRVFQDLFNKSYQAENEYIQYWLAPTQWTPGCPAPATLNELVHREINQSWAPILWSTNTNPETWASHFLIDKWSGKYRYWSHGVMPNLTPDSKIPPGLAERRTKGARPRSILEYTLSMYGSSRTRFFDHYDRSQPVFRAELVSTRRNFLDKHNEDDDEKTKQSYCVCPEPLAKSTVGFFLDPIKTREQLTDLPPTQLPHGFISTALIFPTIISRVDAHLITCEACEQLGLNIQPALALEAMTKAGDMEEEYYNENFQVQHDNGKNYERLEFLGDSFLKLTTTIMIFLRYPKGDESTYHVKRMHMICNTNLFNVAVESAVYLPQYIRSQGFNRRSWYPEGMILLGGKGATKGNKEPVKHEIPQHALAQKTIADVAEALIGAAFLSATKKNDFDMAVRAVTKLVASEDHDVQSWSEYARHYEVPSWSISTRPDGFTFGPKNRAKMIQDRTGYVFKRPRLLRSAMTHNSCTYNTVPNYQRLEFLGDALLDMVCVTNLYQRFPNRGPHWLTEHKMPMVSNKFLAALAVDLGFDKCIEYSGVHVGRQINEFGSEVREQLCDAKRTNAIDFWTELSNAPKFLSDIVESYVGAVFVDSGFDYSEVQKFFDNHVYWYFSDVAIYDSFAKKHPTTELQKLLSNQFNCLVYRLSTYDHYRQDQTEGIEQSDEPAAILLASKAQKANPKVTAGIVIHDTLVQSVDRESGKCAKIAVCKLVLDKIRDLTREEFRSMFRCHCRSEDVAAAFDTTSHGLL